MGAGSATPPSVLMNAAIEQEGKEEEEEEEEEEEKKLRLGAIDLFRWGEIGDRARRLRAARARPKGAVLRWIERGGGGGGFSSALLVFCAIFFLLVLTFFFFLLSQSFIFFFPSTTMGQLAASDSGTRKTSSLDRLKLAASRLLKRTPKPSMTAAVAPSSPPPSQQAPHSHSRDYATRGGKAAARSLARLSATSMVSADEDETSAAATAAAETDAAVANAVPFSRKSKMDDGDGGDDAEPAEIVAGRFSLGLPRDLEAKYDLSDKILGSGGSGIVRLATCKRTGKTVAVKTIPKVSLVFWGKMAEAEAEEARASEVSVRRQQNKILETAARKLSAPRSPARRPFLLAIFAVHGKLQTCCYCQGRQGEKHY